MNRHDDELLRVELEALERAAPTAEPPGIRRATGRMPALAGAVALGLVAAVGVSSWLLWARPGEVGTASPSPTSSAPTTAEPTAEPTPAASAAPTTEPTQTATPEPTAAPRQGWTYTTVASGNVRVMSVVEARGRLFALGNAGANAGIWVSQDGRSWSPADVPPAPEPYGFTAWDLVDTGDRLVVVAAGGLAAGSGYFLTTIYVSEDGEQWRTATTPAIEGTAEFALAQSGDRLFAVGSALWRSDDRGETWTEVMSRSEFGGKAFDVAARGDLIVALGQAGQSDLAEPPMYAWVSRDGGTTWQRVTVDAAGFGQTIAIGGDGTLVASGSGTVWASDDGGTSWAMGDMPGCCYGAVVSTPSGFVMLPDHTSQLPAEVYVSTDGLAWRTMDSIELQVVRATYGPRFGLVAAGDGTVGLGPHPFP